MGGVSGVAGVRTTAHRPHATVLVRDCNEYTNETAKTELMNNLSTGHKTKNTLGKKSSCC